MEKKTRTRTATKKGAVTPAQVEQAVSLGLGFVVMVRGPVYRHWAAQPGEVEAWSAEAAQLLSKIPARVVEGVFNVSAAATVAVGLGTMITRRVAIDQQIAAAIAEDRKQQAAMKQAQQAAPETQSERPAGPVIITKDGTVQGDVNTLFGDAWANLDGAHV